MSGVELTRIRWLLWLGALTLLIAVALFPVSNRFTRGVELGLLFATWFGLIGLLWRRRAIRFFLLGVTLVTGGFLGLPARNLPAADSLRGDYVTCLRRYEGVSYYWGGESIKGIDCSGLVRRGLIDSLFCRGIQMFDPGLVRRSLSLWWHDCTAESLGDGHAGLTINLLDTPSINRLDHFRILPGDLAVTADGIHILAYLGGNRWIEADPGVGRVIAVTVPANQNPWFNTSVKIVRWTILAQ